MQHFGKKRQLIVGYIIIFPTREKQLPIVLSGVAFCAWEKSHVTFLHLLEISVSDKILLKFLCTTFSDNFVVIILRLICFAFIYCASRAGYLKECWHVCYGIVFTGIIRVVTVVCISAVSERKLRFLLVSLHVDDT